MITIDLNRIIEALPKRAKVTLRKTKHGTPTLDDIKGQINLLKDYEREQLHIANVSNMLCGSFDPDTATSSATKCKCGREKWEHPKAT